MSDDFKLLREYVERGSEEAFRALVERHGGMVHGVALRVLNHNDSAAEEVTQAVFVLLAKKAASLRLGTVIGGWLYHTARFVALEARRSELRRQQQEQQFTDMNESPEAAWKNISPLLDEAMGALANAERDAVVLRFLEGKSFAEVAGALGTTEAAAKMRVGRALEKLRGNFSRRGLTICAIALGATLSAHGSASFPSDLAASVSRAALEPVSTHTTLAALVKGALLVMTWNKIRNAALATIILLLVGGGAFLVFQHTRQASSPLPPAVATFEPMAGEWEGTFVMSGDGMAEPLQQATTLSIRTVQQGRACQIEMRVLTPNGRVARTYHFTHSITEAGRRIATQDDPMIGRLIGEGVVTASTHDKNTGEWRAAFHSVLPDGKGTTDCEWVRKGDELTIVRHDRDEHTGEGVSELHLRKSAGNRTAL